MHSDPPTSPQLAHKMIGELNGTLPLPFYRVHIAPRLKSVHLFSGCKMRINRVMYIERTLPGGALPLLIERERGWVQSDP